MNPDPLHYCPTILYTTQMSKEAILDYLVKGMSQVQAAKAAGVTEGYVSQLMSDEAFSAEVAARRANLSARAAKIDDNYDAIEALVTDRLKQIVEVNAALMNTDKLLQIGKFVNSASRKSTVGAEHQTGGNTYQVTITLPSGLKTNTLQLLKSTNNEVLAVDGRELLPMPSNLLLAKAAKPTDLTITDI